MQAAQVCIKDNRISQDQDTLINHLNSPLEEWLEVHPQIILVFLNSKSSYTTILLEITTTKILAIQLTCPTSPALDLKIIRVARAKLPTKLPKRTIIMKTTALKAMKKIKQPELLPTTSSLNPNSFQERAILVDKVMKINLSSKITPSLLLLSNNNNSNSLNPQPSNFLNSTLVTPWRMALMRLSREFSRALIRMEMVSLILVSWRLCLNLFTSHLVFPKHSMKEMSSNTLIWWITIMMDASNLKNFNLCSLNLLKSGAILDSSLLTKRMYFKIPQTPLPSKEKSHLLLLIWARMLVLLNKAKTTFLTRDHNFMDPKVRLSSLCKTDWTLSIEREWKMTEILSFNFRMIE